MALIVNDRYAGDEAWREWFEICSVAEVYAPASSNHP